jgi:hypothetical protein
MIMYDNLVRFFHFLWDKINGMYVYQNYTITDYEMKRTGL